MIARLEPDRRIPKKLRETYAHLAGNVMWTYGALEELMFLFGTSENVHLLNETAPAFFVRHQGLLIDDIALSLSRMTDEKQSGSRKNPQENLTLARLLDLPDAQCQQLRTELKKRIIYSSSAGNTAKRNGARKMPSETSVLLNDPAALFRESICHHRFRYFR
jgi:hypothetical protein